MYNIKIITTKFSKYFLLVSEPELVSPVIWTSRNGTKGVEIRSRLTLFYKRILNLQPFETIPRSSFRKTFNFYVNDKSKEDIRVNRRNIVLTKGIYDKKRGLTNEKEM